MTTASLRQLRELLRTKQFIRDSSNSKKTGFGLLLTQYVALVIGGEGKRKGITIKSTIKKGTVVSFKVRDFTGQEMDESLEKQMYRRNRLVLQSSIFSSEKEFSLGGS